MFYAESQKVTELKHRVKSFMDRHVYPNEERFYKEAESLGPWQVYPIVEELKPKARGGRPLESVPCRKASMAPA